MQRGVERNELPTGRIYTTRNIAACRHFDTHMTDYYIYIVWPLLVSRIIYQKVIICGVVDGHALDQMHVMYELANREPSMDSYRRLRKDNDITALLLLLRSGDVETNPGPKRKHPSGSSTTVVANDFDDILKLVAKQIEKNSEIDDLGKALGFEAAEIARYTATNHKSQRVTCDGTLDMLRDWRKKQTVEGERPTLRNALNAAGLIRIGEKFLTAGKRGLYRHDGEDVQPLEDILLDDVVEDLKRFYIDTLCRIQADPLSSDTLLQFDQIFTNLTLLEENTYNKTIETPLDYTDLLKTKVNGLLARRLLVQAEGGAGKTTFSYKIAWDWAHGIDFKQFKLVIVVLLRNSKNKSIGEVVKSYLSDSTGVSASQLDGYILKNPDKVFVVMDGLDEYDWDSGLFQLVPIILYQEFKSVTVLITSRQWKAHEIRGIHELKMVYALIAIKGFSVENLASYITKFFDADTESSKELISFIADNDVIRENMAPFPIYTAMLCIMWKEYDGERRQAMSLLKTFSQLFDEMISFLIGHYLSKGAFHTDVDNHIWLYIYNHICTIGKIAFQGLLTRRLVFPEDTFKACTDSMEIGCKVGVLTREACAIPRRKRQHHLQAEESLIQFTHKLFQEYVSAKYLASLHTSKPSEYDTLMDNIIKNAGEYRNLLFFTSAQGANVGLDIVRRLIEVDYNESFLIDVTYESQDLSVTNVVVDHFRKQDSIQLIIDENMSAHLLAGHTFVIKNGREVDGLVLRKSCRLTASSDIAEIMCSSSTLRRVDIGSPSAQTTMHDVFYSTLANEAEHCQIHLLNISWTDLSEHPVASRHFAHLISKMPNLKTLSLYKCQLHDDFYKYGESVSASIKIGNLEILCIDLKERPDASRHLAQFICQMPHLKSLKFLQSPVHEDFYICWESVGASSKIETLEISSTDVRECPSASFHLAQFICKMPLLKSLEINDCPLHDDFYIHFESVCASSKIENLEIFWDNLCERHTASRHLAHSICKMPHLKTLKFVDCPMHDDFYTSAETCGASTKIENLEISKTDLGKRPVASRQLAQFICKIPLLKSLKIIKCPLHDDFYISLESIGASTKIENLEISRTNLSERPEASRRLAQFICKMPLLEFLKLDQCLFHDDFDKTLNAMGTSSQVKRLQISRK